MLTSPYNGLASVNGRNGRMSGCMIPSSTEWNTPPKIPLIAAMGIRKSAALAWLRRTDELSNHNYPWFKRDKNWNNLHSHPEYQRILAGIQRHWERYREEFGGS